MERLPLSANKGNLLRLEEELSLARGGRDLLEEKKQALIVPIAALAAQAERVRAEMEESLGEAYDHLREALAAHGRLVCERAALAARAGAEVEVRERSFMGVALPVVRLELPKLAPSYGFLESGASMDAIAEAIRRSLGRVAELAELEVGLSRLIAEIRRTIRRVNALENVHIPVYEATVKHMVETLEEKEREFLFQLKRRKG